jgi:hypothetical protein
MYALLSIVVALSTPAYAADLDIPIPQPVAFKIEYKAPEPTPEVSKPLPPEPSQRPEACNCYRLIKETYGEVPTMDTLIASATNTPGNVAVFMYPPATGWPNGIPHVALVRGKDADGNYLIEEYNYHRCTHSTRTIPPTYRHLIGFVNL